MAQFFRNFTGQANGAAVENSSYPWGAPETGRINTTSFAFPVYEESHTGNREVPLVFNEVPSATTIEVVAKVRTTFVQDVGTDYQMDIVTRGSGGSTTRTGRTTNFLRSRFINCEGYNANTSFTFGAGSAYNFVANQWYWIRVRTTGNDTQYRVWVDGATEPTGWDTATTTNVTGAGWAGIGSWVGNGTRYWAQVGIATNGDTAPTGPVDTTLSVNTLSVATTNTNTTLTVPTQPLADVGGPIFAPFGGFIPGISGFGLGYRIGSTPVAPSDMSVGTVTESPTMLQDYLIAVNAISVANSMDNIATIYDLAISINNLLSSTTMSAPGITQDYKMFVDNISVTTFMEQILSLGFEIYASAAAIMAATSIDNIDLIQLHTLDINDLSSATTLSTTSLIENRTLEMAHMLVTTDIDPATIIQDYLLALSNLLANPTIDNIVVAQAHYLAVQNLQVNISQDNLYIFSPLLIDDLLVSTSIDKIIQTLDLYKKTGIVSGSIDDAGPIDNGILIPNTTGGGTLEQVSLPETGIVIPATRVTGSYKSNDVFTILLFDENTIWLAEDDEHVIVEEYDYSASDDMITFENIKVEHGILY